MHVVDSNINEILLHGSLTGNSDVAVRHAKAGNPSAYYDALAKERGAFRPLDDLLGLPPAERNKFSVLRAAAAQLPEGHHLGGFERDVDALVTQRTGLVANGIWMPFGAVSRDFSVGTASEAGNLVGVARYGDAARDPARPVTVLGSLPVTVLHGLRATTSVPTFISTSAPTVSSEIAAATEILTATASADLSPITVRVIATFARQALLQSSVDLEKGFQRQLSAASLSTLERLVLAGTGSDGEPTGIVRRSDVNIVSAGADGAALTWPHLASMEKSAALANVAPGAAAFITNPKVTAAMRTTQRGTGLDYLMPTDHALGYPVLTTTNMPSDLTKGSGSNLSAAIFSADWSQLCLGFYGAGFDVTVDPITRADRGEVRVIASLTFGFGLLRPTAFSVMKDIVAS